MHAHRVLPIRRGPRGRFIGLGPAESLAPKPTLGRFSRLLPECAPSDAERQVALTALTSIGVRIPPCERGGL
jgi:hypothetical protein